MHVIPHMISAPLVPPSALLPISETVAVGNLQKSQPPLGESQLQVFRTPVKANPQSVVQAQIKDEEVASSRDTDIAAARRKSIMGMLPANPSVVTKLMSALAAATSAEAIADIKLDAQPN